MTRGRYSRLAAAGAIGLAAGLAALAVGRLPLARTAEWKLYDLRMRAALDPAGAPAEIAIVEIDEQTVRALEPVAGRWPWPRVFHAGLIDFLARAPARVIAYDVLFLERDRRERFTLAGQSVTGAESDAALADAVTRAGTVVLLADATYTGSAQGRDDPARGSIPDQGFRLAEPLDERPIVTAPFTELAAGARALGHNLFVLDDDGPIRRFVPFVSAGGRHVPSLATAAFVTARRIPAPKVEAGARGLTLGTTRLPLLEVAVPRLAGEGGALEARHALIRFRGPALLPDGKTPTYRTYSFGDLLVSEEQLQLGQPPRIDPAEFRDRVVFVGTTAKGLHDVFMTPLGSSGSIPGAQIHAAIYDELSTGRTLERAGGLAVAATTFAAGLLVAWASAAWPLRAGGPAVLAAAFGLYGAGLALFRSGVWLSLVEPLLATALAGVGGLAWQYFVEGREKRQVTRLFSRYVSKDVFDQVLANPALAELGGRRRVMTVLFSDVRGFTSLSERGDPEALVAQLNEYFSRMVAIVFAHRGTLDKFVGDMVMALFGAPLDDPDHAYHAVSAARDMVRALEELNRTWEAEGRPTLGIGIGVSTGEMIAGNIGSDTVRSYTVIGDAVNLGARLESLNKDHGTTIIVSATTASALGGRVPLRPMGAVVVKGKTVPVEIFEVTL
jgi:adenylate cyclase